MRRPLYSIVLFIAIFLLASCANRKMAATLNDVETYIQVRPDSALATIRAIDTTTLTTRGLRAHYALLHAMALDKNWIDTTDVSVVMPAVEYYTKHGNADQKMKSYYYLGRIQQNGHDFDAAIISFSRAESAAGGSRDDRFKGMVDLAFAEVYKRAHYADKEREYIESGMMHFLNAKDTAHYNLCLGSLAMSYQEKKEWQKADSLYKKALELAVRDSAAMRMFLAHYAAMKVAQPDVDPQGALDLLKAYYTDYQRALPLKEYGIYAYASALVGDDKTCDAILSVLQRQPKDRRKESRYYEYLIARHRGDYKQAIALLTDTYIEQDNKVDQLLNNSVTQVLQNFYQEQALESEHKAQILRLSFAVIILSILLLFGVIIFLIIRKRERDRLASDNLIRMAEETNALLLRSNSQLESQVKEIESSRQSDALAFQNKYRSLQQSYIQLFKNQFDTVNSLCKTYLKNLNKPEETRKTVIYGKVKDIIAFIGKDKKQHALFEEQINRDLDNIVAHLKADLGKVSDKDARFICYTIAGFEPNIVAALLNLSLSNVYTKRSRLRDRIRQLDSPYKDQYLRSI